MNYVLVDPTTNKIVNIIVWDGVSPYDPAPYLIRPAKETDAIGKDAG